MEFRIERNNNLNTYEVWAAFGICTGKGFKTSAEAQAHIDDGSAKLYIERHVSPKDKLLLGYVATPEQLRRLIHG